MIDPRPAYPDIGDPLFWDCWFAWREMTLLSVERLYALYRSVRHAAEQGTAGAFCECGVFRGGASCLCAAALLALGHTALEFYWYDTFCGFLPGVDAQSITGESLQDFPRDDMLPQALAHFGQVGYPRERLHVTRGPVEETLPAAAPARIAVLHLDMDYPVATRHALTHLYPRLEPGGALHVDDYGHFPAVAQAVEAFFAPRKDAPLLVRVDYTGRVGVKPGPMRGESGRILSLASTA